MNFEEKLQDLENIIQRLESGDVKFDQAISMFEEGSKICKDLSEQFKQAEGKITVIREILGSIIEENYKRNNIEE